jgi:hypothetical protein
MSSFDIHVAKARPDSNRVIKRYYEKHYYRMTTIFLMNWDVDGNSFDDGSALAWGSQLRYEWSSAIKNELGNFQTLYKIQHVKTYGLKSQFKQGLRLVEKRVKSIHKQASSLWDHHEWMKFKSHFNKRCYRDQLSKMNELLAAEITRLSNWIFGANWS